MKIFRGRVISKKMDKTATVVVDRVVVHPVYKKRYKRTRKYQVHDELGVAVGETVQFTASKPYSKTKRWKILGRVEGEVGRTVELRTAGGRRAGRKVGRGK